MAKCIIRPTRKLPQLKGSLLLTAIELAHRADGFSGQVTISYTYLASKTHQSRRTAIRHVGRLISLGIIKVQRFWAASKRWGINKYIFTIPWEKPKQMFTGDRLARNLPSNKNKEEGGKFGSLKGEEEMRKKIIDWLTPGSQLWTFANSFENPG